MPGTTTGSERYAALGHRNFRVLWSGLIVSNTGTWMQNVAQAWLVLQLTNSPLWLGFLGLSFALPMTVGPLFTGAVVDRVDRMRLLRVTQTCMLLAASLLAGLTWFGAVNVWWILGSSFVGSLLLAFDNPARQSLIPDLVPPRDLLNALSINSATFNGAALVGPALAGLLLDRFGAALLFALNAVSFLAVLLALFTMRDVKPRQPATHASFGRSVQEGLMFSWRNRLVLTLLTLSALAALFGRSYQNLLPVFARDIWHGGPQGYGLLLSSAGAGAIVGAFGLASFREVRRQTAVMLANGFLFVGSLVAFAASPSLTLGVGLLFVAGVTSTVFITIVATHIQRSTPSHLRGRVMSLYAITLIGLPSLGALGTSALAQWLGGARGAPRAIVVAAAVLGGALLAAGRVLRRARSQEPPPVVLAE